MRKILILLWSVCFIVACLRGETIENNTNDNQSLINQNQINESEY